MVGDGRLNWVLWRARGRPGDQCWKKLPLLLLTPHLLLMLLLLAQLLLPLLLRIAACR